MIIFEKNHSLNKIYHIFNVASGKASIILKTSQPPGVSPPPSSPLSGLCPQISFPLTQILDPSLICTCILQIIIYRGGPTQSANILNQEHHYSTWQYPTLFIYTQFCESSMLYNPNQTTFNKWIETLCLKRVNPSKTRYKKCKVISIIMKNKNCPVLILCFLPHSKEVQKKSTIYIK